VGCLDGKPVVVTGAGRGLGLAYARAAALEGAHVVVNDIDADLCHSIAMAINNSGGTAVASNADVSSWEEAEGLIDFCVAEFGGIHGLVNNAGLFSMALPGEMTATDLADLWRVNVSGVAACGTFAIRRMTAEASGSIVNVVSGAHFGMKYMAADGATKGAVASLTYAWALELEDTGVRVNAISPLARTRMGESAANFFEKHDLGTVHLGQTPDASANAPVVVFLLSDAASRLNGQLVRIEGRQLALVSHPAVLDPIIISDEGWRPETIAATFEGVLSDRLVPTGMAPLLKAQYVTGSSELWDGTVERADA
jgi:NAD(P)-dependent dehydrogenase (short-subunit alcohol dehydrogenase family)